MREKNSNMISLDLISSTYEYGSRFFLLLGIASICENIDNLGYVSKNNLPINTSFYV